MIETRESLDSAQRWLDDCAMWRRGLAKVVPPAPPNRIVTDRLTVAFDAIRACARELRRAFSDVAVEHLRGKPQYLRGKPPYPRPEPPSRWPRE